MTDAVISIQAFLFNIFAATDNLAWLWVSERQITRKDGLPLPPTSIGLRENNVEVRSSFSEGLRTFLDELNPWFRQLEEFRHSLAHRIPLYIPPLTVQSSKENQTLENSIEDAMRAGDFEKYKSLRAEQDKLSEFRPIMLHSYSEKSEIVCFHPQMLVDFDNIESLGYRILDELDRKSGR